MLWGAPLPPSHCHQLSKQGGRHEKEVSLCAGRLPIKPPNCVDSSILEGRCVVGVCLTGFCCLSSMEGAERGPSLLPTMHFPPRACPPGHPSLSRAPESLALAWESFLVLSHPSTNYYCYSNDFSEIRSSQLWHPNSGILFSKRLTTVSCHSIKILFHLAFSQRILLYGYVNLVLKYFKYVLI